MSHKICSRCGITKETELFIKNRNICKECNNSRRKELLKIKLEKLSKITDLTCNKCGIEKTINSFIKGRNICNECNNKTRRDKYNNNEEYKQRMKQERKIYKNKKTIERRMKKQAEIGIGNKKCNYCNIIKIKDRFRHNRLKCKDCERDNPIEKFKRNIRTRIYISLRTNKNKKTIEYLGCNYGYYVKWISYNSHNFTLENHGSVWHIDHVIPLSKFDLEDEKQLIMAFNWRNTTAISKKENLSKNNKIIIPQLHEHFEKLKQYHIENRLYLPQVYIDLFAKYLDAGTPLEPLLPFSSRNVTEELG
jgi:hypothetical protein